MATSLRLSCSVGVLLLLWERRETTSFLAENLQLSMQKMHTRYVVICANNSFISDLFKHLTTPVFGKGVVYDVPNDIFMQQKKFIKVGLSTENLKAYVGMIEGEVEEFINNDPAFSVYQRKDNFGWGSFDVMTVAAEIIILTAARTLQGKEVRGGMDKTFADLYTDLDGGFTPLNFLFPNLPLESYRKRDRAHQKLSQFYVNIVKKRKAANDDVRFSSSSKRVTDGVCAVRNGHDCYPHAADISRRSTPQRY